MFIDHKFQAAMHYLYQWYLGLQRYQYVVPANNTVTVGGVRITLFQLATHGA